MLQHFNLRMNNVSYNRRGNCVSNLSSSRALSDIAHVRESQYFAAAVGEVNVVEKMKECSAQIGGEGNGGIIYPPLHYGRDSLVGIALFLTYLAKLKIANSDINFLLILGLQFRTSKYQYRIFKGII